MCVAPQKSAKHNVGRSRIQIDDQLCERRPRARTSTNRETFTGKRAAKTLRKQTQKGFPKDKEAFSSRGRYEKITRGIKRDMTRLFY